MNRDCFGEAKGNRKQKVTGVLSDVVSKINFKVGRLATKDRWEGKRRSVFIGLPSLLPAAGTERAVKIKEDKTEKWAEHIETHWKDTGADGGEAQERVQNREKLGQLNWADCALILTDRMSLMRNMYTNDQLPRV